eukprot:366371-Chlamydomonas_euryale.AAC.19
MREYTGWTRPAKHGVISGHYDVGHGVQVVGATTGLLGVRHSQQHRVYLALEDVSRVWATANNIGTSTSEDSVLLGEGHSQQHRD